MTTIAETDMGEAQSVGKASRKKRKEADRSKRRTSSPDQKSTEQEQFPGVSAAEAALGRLMRTNKPGKMSLAGAYAWGYAAVAGAHMIGDVPDWYDELDPLDLLLFGAAFPGGFSDGMEFGNARTAWLQALRGTKYWKDVQRFVSAVVEVSRDADLPVDDPRALLLLNGCLEDAGLDQRKLPPALNPLTALADARFVQGISTDFALLEPSARAHEQAAAFLAALEVDGVDPDTCAALLANALFLLDRFGRFFRDEAGILLIGLYIALAATDDEPVEDLGDRVHAWTLGLRAESSLATVVDAVVAASAGGLTVEEALRHLFMLPAFLEVVDYEDRRWHSAPATDLVPLAFKFGHERIRYAEHETVQLGAVNTAWLESVERRNEELGISSWPGGRLVEDERQFLKEVAERLRAAGIHPAWIHAFTEDDAPLPRSDGSFLSEEHHRDWSTAVGRYYQLHPEDGRPDDPHEFVKWRAHSALQLVIVAADDDVFARQFIQWFEDGVDERQVDVVIEFMESAENLVLTAVENDPGLEARSLALAERWGGAVLAHHVKEYLLGDRDEDLISPSELFVLTVAYCLSQRRC